ncbi:Uncharacterized conserved protein, DUF2267 family [Marinobacter daqiaonensis]|uniref:Uncharacterized conserved protein, DUF2267 family n=1 Tax=Marinobacter daqiaonensis TaxID=650891 RepID=A0A1I6GY77_9GAMM|nr:DUF2267 domain-containing protein [Marinobacter daqiaonensis]SFR47214.1 Uncharacterized conserved protein, DUF2267 family [Marinobacter daqiaonensis]
MQFHEFLGQVQNRAKLDSPDAAMLATRATLNTLAERLSGNEPANLAAQLPGEIGNHLKTGTAGKGERFNVDDFIARVSKREGVPENQATHHAQVVMGVLNEAVSTGEMADVQGQLPEDYALLFRREWA